MFSRVLETVTTIIMMMRIIVMVLIIIMKIFNDNDNNRFSVIPKEDNLCKGSDLFGYLGGLTAATSRCVTTILFSYILQNYIFQFFMWLVFIQ